MPEIVRVWVDFALTWIGLDQYPIALAGLSEVSPVGPAGPRDSDMAPCHTWVDAIAILPIRGSVTLPVSGLEFDRPLSSRHSLRSGRRF
jgi:hypothetical protein